jgi:hypothetical protein
MLDTVFAAADDPEELTRQYLKTHLVRASASPTTSRS